MCLVFFLERYKLGSLVCRERERAASFVFFDSEIV